jgi:hypothetical protein
MKSIENIFNGHSIDEIVFSTVYTHYSSALTRYKTNSMYQYVYLLIQWAKNPTTLGY